MAPRELAHREDDVFAVPLRDGGYGIGVVARRDGKRAVLGYFFDPRYDSPPAVHNIGGLTALDAVLVQSSETLVSFAATGP